MRWVVRLAAKTRGRDDDRDCIRLVRSLDLDRLDRDDVARWLEGLAAAEGVELAATGLRLLVSLAEGSLRDGLSLLDQVVAGADGVIDEAAVVGALSTSTLTTFRRPSYSPAISSTMGATARHGPHHTAQKSIKTGLSDLRTVSSKFASVISTVLPAITRLLESRRHGGTSVGSWYYTTGSPRPSPPPAALSLL